MCLLKGLWILELKDLIITLTTQIYDMISLISCTMHAYIDSNNKNSWMCSDSHKSHIIIPTCKQMGGVIYSIILSCLQFLISFSSKKICFASISSRLTTTTTKEPLIMCAWLCETHLDLEKCDLFHPSRYLYLPSCFFCIVFLKLWIAFNFT